MRRGDLVVGVASRAYGKPRPHLVVQADAIGPADCASVWAASSVIAAPNSPAHKGLRQCAETRMVFIVMQF